MASKLWHSPPGDTVYVGPFLPRLGLDLGVRLTDLDFLPLVPGSLEATLEVLAVSQSTGASALIEDHRIVLHAKEIEWL